MMRRARSGGCSSLLTDLVGWWPCGRDIWYESHAALGLNGAGSYYPTSDGRGGWAGFFGLNGKLFGNVAAARGGDVDFTFCGWIRPENIAAYPYIGGCWSVGNAGQAYLIQMTSTGAYFYANTGSTVVWANGTGTTSVANGAWSLVIGWHDSVNDLIGVQVNNAAVRTTAFSAGARLSTSPFVIGQADDTYDPTSKSICRVGYWSRLLEPNEREWLWQNGNGIDYPFTRGCPAPRQLPWNR